MLKKEIQKRVCEMWRRERPKQPTDNDMFWFFGRLQKNHPELTIFQPVSKDPWQTIHCWLIEEENKAKKHK